MENSVVIFNFSGIYERETFWRGEQVHMEDCRGLSGCNCYCDQKAWEALLDKIKELPVSGIHFLDSGNYHYMTRLWLERIRKPFQLLVFDNHTDMQPPAFGGLLSCGGWMASALRELPALEKVWLVGPSREDWEPVDAKLKEKVRILTREELKEGADLLAFLRQMEEALPLYISIDKDVLSQEVLHTNWSQGDMSGEVLLKALEYVEKQAGDRLLGVDICGECEPEATEFQVEANSRWNRGFLERFRRLDWRLR